MRWSRQMHRERGASVIELMAVSGLITVCTAFAFSSLRPYADRFRVKGAAAVLASELARARHDAVRTRLCHYFVPNGGGFTIARDDAAIPNCQYDAGDPALRTVTFNREFSGVTFSAGGADSDPYGVAVFGPAPTNMRFEPRGLVTATGGSAIFVSGTNAGPIAVTVSVAGAIRTWRLDGGTWK